MSGAAQVGECRARALESGALDSWLSRERLLCGAGFGSLKFRSWPVSACDPSALSNANYRPIPLKNSLVVRGASAGLQRDKWICKLFEGSTSAFFPVSALKLPMQVLASPPVTSIGT